MQLHAGMTLQSAGESDLLFHLAIIFITELNEGGAVGFIVNKPAGRKLNELLEFRHSPSLPLYSGGPVDEGHLFFIHRRPDLIADGISVAEGIYMGGNFKNAIHHINNRTITANDIKLFIGYCGWNNEELQSEISQGEWVTTEMAEEVFTL